MKNWAGNYEYGTHRLHVPETVEKIQAVVEQCDKLRVLGTRHSFNAIADSSENLLSLEKFTPFIKVDHVNRRALIAGSINYGELSPTLQREGFALHNLASLPHISVAGACATATHGSGVHNQNLAAAVSGLEIVAANGDLIWLSREDDGDMFDGVVVSLGALGVVTKLQLDLLPAYEVQQVVYEKLPMPELEEHFDEIMSSAYSVSLFTHWQPDYIPQVWLKKRVGDPAKVTAQTEFFGAVPAPKKMHPIPELSAEPCTEQLDVPGHWYQRLPHFRLEATPSAGNELQSEYFVAREDAVVALRAINSLRDKIAPHLLVSEIRTVAADNFWMSPCHHRDSIGIHFTWKPDWRSVQKVLPMIEAHLAPFRAKPHWGKLFTMQLQQLQPLYEKLPEFRQLIQQYDPHGKFRNAFLEANLFGD